MLVHRGGRGKTSRLEFPETWTKGANLFNVRDGKVTKMVVYFDRRRALVEVGLGGDPYRFDN